MSLPLCPGCGAEGMRVVDRAADIKPGEPDSPAAYTVAVHRSYKCVCGLTVWTSEVVTTWKPATTRLRRKFGVPATAQECAGSRSGRDT